MGCGDGGKFLRHGLPDGDEHGGIFCLDRTQFFAHGGSGLGELDDQACHLYGELAAFFGSFGQQAVAGDQLDGLRGGGGVHLFSGL